MHSADNCKNTMEMKAKERMSFSCLGALRFNYLGS
jgi:hypothetical protein